MKILKKPIIIVLLLTLLGALLRFYNLNWGSPFYFHPDERNIASAVSQLQFPNQMNPHFFAYGSLPIYIIYFTGVTANYFSSFLNPKPLTLNPTFEQAIVIGRTFSALFATILIPILYLLGKKLKDKKTGLLAAFFATTGVAFIQFSHFGTFEMWLTFFSVLLFWVCLSYLLEPNGRILILISLLFGILIAIKVTLLALLPISLVIIFIKQLPSLKKESRKTEILIHNSLFIIFLKILKTIVLFSLISLFIYCITN